MNSGRETGPHNVALVGPYLSGKTTLLENLLFVSGGVHRKGNMRDGNTVGDSSAEARDRGMSVEVNVATTSFMDDQFTFLDCPGSIEFSQEMAFALKGADCAVVVCEPEADKALALAPILKQLDDLDLPRFIFVNKMDRAVTPVADLVAALDDISSKPVVLRHVPIRQDEEVTGYVDLASEKTYHWEEGAASSASEPPAEMADELADARFAMLEKLSDFNDELMEKLLEDEMPPMADVYGHLTECTRSGDIVPVLLGAAEHEHGVRRLLKALRHETPAAAVTAERLGVNGSDTVAQVLKTYHTAHGGKLSVARIWSGALKDGMTMNGERVSGIFHLSGLATEKAAEAKAGEIVALGRMESVATNDTLIEGKESGDLARAEVPQAVYAMKLKAADRNDEVKLSGAMNKLLEEDPSLTFEHEHDTNEWILAGQGEMHLRVAVQRLENKYGLKVEGTRPKVPYKEAIRKSVEQHARFKRQTGGHGQFGDVHVEIKPLPRGTGFQFEDKIVGGSIPRQFIPAVEAGIVEYLSKGPLGFPVVDLAVRLYDGQFHAVDSSELAFKTAGRMAMSEGLPKCDPVLLEPILQVDIYVPNEATPKANALVSSRRGQIMGFDAREGWLGWDVVQAQLPQSEIHDLIIELRSISSGVGSYGWKYHHLQELSGSLADKVIAAYAEEE
ncbi:MAG TPA: elongation factor G [Alphaproteobacteria bacterium]|nr:elongation factor G [Alphaproteobacteria bacterium]MDP6269779.1 elongation factor G [Alphaproteobacteria bacterium]MDP7428967.1 elongation factor G [Alphaproteobacteria bacterium]HJM51552.1 elongation factor G [Alphaproteobacteria bacterium]